MKNSTQSNRTTANKGSLNEPDTNPKVLRNTTNGTLRRICRTLLAAAALLALLPTLQASEWGFNLLSQPSAERSDEESHEIFQLTGAGKFNPEAGIASGGGSFAFFDAVDEFDTPYGGPTFRGTWQVVDFIGWTPDGGPNPGLQGGTLQVVIDLHYTVGLNAESKGLVDYGVGLTIICPFVDGQFIESEDAINLEYFGGESFAANTTGFTGFHIKKP